MWMTKSQLGLVLNLIVLDFSPHLFWNGFSRAPFKWVWLDKHHSNCSGQQHFENLPLGSSENVICTSTQENEKGKMSQALRLNWWSWDFFSFSPVCANSLSMSHHTLCVWTLKSTLISHWIRHMVEGAQAVWREGTWGKGKVVALMLRKRMKIRWDQYICTPRASTG